MKCFWLALRGCTFWQRWRTFYLNIITSSDQLLQAFLFAYLYPPRSPRTRPLHDFQWLWRNVFNMPAFINHSNMFPLGASKNALSVYVLAFPRLADLTLVVHFFFIFTRHRSLTLCSPHLKWDICGSRGVIVEIKGTQQRRGWFGTLLMWFCMFHKPSKSFLLFFFLPFLNVCNVCACV